jgi:hypothetical protein
MRRLLMAFALGTSALAGAGCAGSGRATYAVSASYTQPELAYVRPGVYVVADYNEPVFYTNNLYWRYDNGRWYSSNYYNGGWRYSTAPRVLYTIDRPYAYVRYRPQTRYVVRGDGRIYVRDHRQARRGSYRRY